MANKTLQQFREKYPQYNAMTDKELADKLYEKYYSDFDRADFDMRLGLKEAAPQKGLKGVGQDIAKGAKAVPHALKEMLMNLPKEFVGYNKQLYTEPTRPLKNMFLGADLGARGLLNTPSNIANYLAEKELIEPQTAKAIPRTLEYDLHEPLGLQERKPGDVLAQSLTASLPYVLGGELGALGVLPRMAARAGAQGAYAIGQNENPVTAALMAPAIEAPVRAGTALYNAARPSNLFRGNLPTEDLAANLRAAEGTNTDLGNIIGSPTLKGIFENLSTKWPGSGADALLGRMANQVEGRAQNLLNQAGEGLPAGDRNRILKETIENAYDAQRNIKNELYKPVDEIAAAQNFNLELPSLEKFSHEFGATVNKSPLMQNDPTLRGIFNDLSKYKEATKAEKFKNVGADALMQKPKITYPSLAEAKSLANRLNNEAVRHSKSNNPTDHFIAGKYADAAKAIRRDIKNQINTKGSPELKSALEAADKNYAENYSQFLDKDVYKWTRPDTEAQTIINDIIQPGKQGDKYSRIQKIQSVLPEEQRGILGDAWLRQAVDKEGNLNAKQLAQMINKVGPRQFEALFPDPVYRQQLLDYGRLRGMNEKALSRMANPSTGATLGAPSMLMGQMGTVINAATHGNIPGALAYAFGPQVGSYLINRALTSPTVRSKFIQTMLENEARGPQPPRRLQGAPLLSTQNYDVYED